MSRGSSRGSSSTTSPTPHVRVPRHIARLVTRLVVDYFDYAAHPDASAHHAARHAAHRVPRRRLLRLRRVSGCLGTSCGSLSTSSPTPRVRVPRHIAQLVVDFFAYAARPGASARRAARHAISRRLLRVHHAFGCLGTSRGSLRRSSSTTSPCAGPSSTTSPTPRVQVPRHVARLVSLLVVDYFTYTTHPGASARRAARHAARCRLLRAPCFHLAATLALLQPCRASRLLASRQHWLCFVYAGRCCDVVFRSHRVGHSSRLVFQTSRERQPRPQQLVGINSD
jgi:hypothetical protein